MASERLGTRVSPETLRMPFNPARSIFFVRRRRCGLSAACHRSIRSSMPGARGSSRAGEAPPETALITITENCPSSAGSSVPADDKFHGGEHAGEHHGRGPAAAAEIKDPLSFQVGAVEVREEIALEILLHVRGILVAHDLVAQKRRALHVQNQLDQSEWIVRLPFPSRDEQVAALRYDLHLPPAAGPLLDRHRSIGMLEDQPHTEGQVCSSCSIEVQ
jgi:hypothetical protein